ncbi:MAG: c-type cytochrome biogenesis protein CcmI [Pseudomonadota bacterium]
MTGFILLAALLTILVLAVLVWPLLKTGNTQSYARQAQNIHFARERMEELDQQLANNSISKEDYEALKLEIESTLATDIDLVSEEPSPSATENRHSSTIVIILLCCLIPFAGLVLYQVTGTPAAVTLSAADPATAQTAQDPQQLADIESMLASLEQRLEQQPNDIEGWAMLARSYQAMGRYTDAIKASQKRLQYGGENADAYAALADSSAMLAGGALAGEPTTYVMKALSLNEAHPQALWLAGLAAAQSGDNEIARGYWNRLMPLLAGAPQQQQELQEIIQQSIDFDQQNESVADVLEQAPPSTAEPKAVESPAANALTVSVSLDPAVRELVEDADPVFVFARAYEGPPAPLAAKRFTVADLPLTTTLSDADAMMPQLKLSMFDQTMVVARVAKSGSPISQPGDIQSQEVPIMSESPKQVDLNISIVIK